MLKMFDKYMHQIYSFKPSIRPNDLWTLICRAQLVEGGVPWLSSWLWRYRLHSFRVSLLRGRCLSCGDVINPGSRSDANFCSTRCRVRAHRERVSGSEASFYAEIQESSRVLDGMEEELESFRSWRSSIRSRTVVMPVDLLSVDSLPDLPPRCGGGCAASSACSITGRVCFYGATLTSLSDPSE
jgi:hypothetical protein